MTIAERAKNKWRAILPQLGIETKFLGGKHGPCPACGGKDRFRFDDRNGVGGFFCSQCGAGDGFRLLQLVRGWGFAEAAREVEAIVGTASEQPPKPKLAPDRAREMSRNLWASCEPIGRGDVAAAYLAARHLSPPSGQDLRFCKACDVSGVAGVRQLPAMVALVRSPEGEAVTLHRTYLGNGTKAVIESPRRIMPGDMGKGVAIRLMPHEGMLGIAEGIETALAASQRFGIPCWSALDEGKLRDFAIPEDVTELHVFGDNDANYVGQAAAYGLAARAARLRRRPKVEVHIPPTIGDDWADVLAAESGQAVASA